MTSSAEGTLTPIEFSDNTESLSSRTFKHSSVPHDTVENNTMPLSVYTANTVLLHDTEVSSSYDTKTEPLLSQSKDTRTEPDISHSNHPTEPDASYSVDEKMVEAVSENILKVKPGQSSVSTDRTSSTESYPSDSSPNNGYEKLGDDGNDDYNFENRNKKANYLASSLVNEEAINETTNNIFADSDDEGGAERHTGLDKNKSSNECSDGIFRDYENDKNNAEKLSDFDSYVNKHDTCTKNDFPSSDQSSGHNSRVSVKEDNKRHDNEAYNTFALNLIETSSRENGPENSPKCADNRNSQRSLQEKDTSALSFSFDGDKKGTGYTEYKKRNSSEDVMKVDDDVYTLDDPLDTFYNDMLRHVDTSDPPFENITYVEHTDPKKNSKNKYSIDDSNLEIGELDNKSKPNANNESITNDNQMNENANIETAVSTLKQTKTTDALEIEYEVNSSTESKSASGIEYSDSQTVLFLSKEDIPNVIKQNGTHYSESETREEHISDAEVIIAQEMIAKSSTSSNEEENTEKSGIYKSYNFNENDETKIDVSNSLPDKEVSLDITGNQKAIPYCNNDLEVKVNEEMKLNNALPSHTKKIKRGKASSNSTNTNISGVKMSKPDQGTLFRSVLSHKNSNYQSLVEMKALDRLLNGPYSERFNEKTPSPRSGTYRNPTKSSAGKIRKQKQSTSIKTVDQEIGITGAITPGKKNNSASSFFRQTKITGSQSSSAKSENGKSLAKVNIKNENKSSMDKSKKSANGIHKKSIVQFKSHTLMNTKDTFGNEGTKEQSKLHPSIIEANVINNGTLKSASVEQASDEPVRDETMVFLDEANLSEVEKNLTESVIFQPEVSKMETQELKTVLESSQFEVQNIETAKVIAGFEKRIESDNLSLKKNKNVVKKKPSTLREWFKTKKKIKETSAKLLKKQGTKYQEAQTIETDQLVDIKSILITTSQDSQDTMESAVENIEKPPIFNDPVVIPPASVIIIDETSKETKVNSLLDQAIFNNILQKYEANNTLDNSISTAKFPIDSFPESPPPESILGNSFGKFNDTTASKSVSIKSLTVPGLLHNPFVGEAPVDEDTASMYSRRDSTRQSFDSVSRKSIDYRIRNTTLVTLPMSDEKPKSVITNEESFIKNAIPFLPMNLAVICLILNIIIPGSGTALSGLSILFCGQPRVPNKDDQVLITLCANCMVGVAQLFTVTFLLVGWFWSIGWGVEMVMLAVQHEREMKEERSKKFQSFALSAFGSPDRQAMFGN